MKRDNALELINKKSMYFLLLILVSNFAIRLTIYFNTTLFYFSDYKSYLDAIERIKEYGNIPLIQGTFVYLNSYIGYFFKYVLGNIDYYFIFNCLLGTLTSFIIYIICVKLTKNKIVGLLAILLHSVYLEFMAWSSIFYTPVIMMFLLSLTIYLILIYIDSPKITLSIIIALSIIIVINFTYYFKGEMKYFWVIFMLFGVINFKIKRLFINFLILGLLLFGSTGVLKSYHILPYNEGNVIANDFIFFGHTLYGGDGGDGAFVYQENKDRYDREFKTFCERNEIKKPSGIDRNKFQSEEIKKFITQHPFKWVNLQFYKFCRFFGVVPEGSSFRILISGIMKGDLIITAVLLVVPFALLILAIVITFEINFLKKVIMRPELMLLAIMLLYYLVASVFYGQYQERYRMPLMVCFLIPYLSWAITKFDIKKLMSNKGVMTIKTIAILFVVSIWIFQSYDALIVHKDRYFGVAETFSKGKIN